MGEEQQERRIDSLITEVFGEGEEAELVRTAIREALGATKRVRQNQRCPKCAHVYRGEFTARDPSLVLKTIEWLADRMVGRPGVQKDSGGGEGMVFVNRVGLVDADGSETLGWLDERGLLGKPLAEVEHAWIVGHVTPVEHAEFIADYEAEHPDMEG